VDTRALGREKETEERGRLQKLNSLLSAREDGVLFFIFPTASSALLFACFVFLEFALDGFHSAALLSPSTAVLPPHTGAPILGLCRSIAVACLLQRSDRREKQPQQHPRRWHLSMASAIRATTTGCTWAAGMQLRAGNDELGT